jgi:hypothetical protein
MEALAFNKLYIPSDLMARFFAAFFPHPNAPQAEPSNKRSRSRARKRREHRRSAKFGDFFLPIAENIGKFDAARLSVG